MITWPAALLAIALLLGTTNCGASGEPATPNFGFSPGAGLRDEDDEQVASDFDAMQTVGAGWVRLDIDWSIVEPESGRYDWSTSDRLIDAARERGFNVLALLAYTPAWARPEGTNNKHAPLDNQQFAEFAADAVARYGPRGVEAWEVWNEPNSPLFWQPEPEPSEYGGLLVATTEAIRSEDPDATIVSGGLAPAVDGPDASWIAPETFLRHLAETGDLDDVDAVGIHPYSFPALPLDESSAEWNTFLKLPALHRLLLETEAGPDRIWITEYGAPTGSHERSVSEEDQASLMAEALDATERRPWLGPIFLYTLRDLQNDPDDLESNFGIINHDGSPKKAWRDLVVLASLGSSD